MTRHADGWPCTPEETAELSREIRTGHDRELLQRVHDALLDGAVAVERVAR